MARFEEPKPPPDLPPDLPPQLSADFYRGAQPVGSGPQARAFAATLDQGAWGAFPPEVLAPWGPGETPTPMPLPPEQIAALEATQPNSIDHSAGWLPPQFEDQLPSAGTSVRDPENPYMATTYVPAPPPSPTYEANWYERQPSSGSNAGVGVRGRPTAARLGVEGGMSGLARPEDATFLPSNELVRQVLAQLPPVFAMFANRPIGRYTATDIYGDPTNAGGYYQGFEAPSQSPGGPIAPAPSQRQPVVNVGRGAAEPTLNGMTDQLTVARHELFHALSFEAEPFRGDAEKGFPLLRQVVARDAVSLQSDPRLRQVVPEVSRFASINDWAHVFTALAEASLRGPLPPSLQRYFAPMFVQPAQPGRAPMTAPPMSR